MRHRNGFWSKPRIGTALLLLAFAVGCTQLFLNNFADEGENLASGVLALRGRILYRDIFSQYFYMYPWVAEVGLVDAIKSLSLEPAIAFLDINGQVWDYKNKDFLARLKDFLDKNYTQLEDFYLAPTLVDKCYSNK